MTEFFQDYFFLMWCFLGGLLSSILPILNTALMVSGLAIPIVHWLYNKDGHLKYIKIGAILLLAGILLSPITFMVTGKYAAQLAEHKQSLK